MPTDGIEIAAILKHKYPKPMSATYTVHKITNGYILHSNSDATYYKTKKQVAAAVLKHLTKEVQ